MASGNRKRFTCGHRGFGVVCHRCAHAEALKDAAAKPINKSKKEEMLAEAARLLKPAEKKSSKVVQSTIESA
jgi:hypothetical protein